MVDYKERWEFFLIATFGLQLFDPGIMNTNQLACVATFIGDSNTNPSYVGAPIFMK